MTKRIATVTSAFLLVLGLAAFTGSALAGNGQASGNVKADAAEGRIAAEQITPYPPGIPAILPGERINHAVIDYLLSGLEAGMALPDPTDPANIEKVSGRGLLLMRSFMDQVIFNDKANQVTLVKKAKRT